VHYLREELHEKVYGRALADQLSRECLRWMYRLLFLFDIEARPELGYAPMKAEAYRTGYSLESLRDLELVPLNTEEARNGYHLHASLKLLFRLIYRGFRPGQGQLDLHGRGSLHHVFTMEPLQSRLFDPAQTPLLSRVKLRNHVLQRVIELMSLTRPGGGRGRRASSRRGRVSYAQLGINQLGAVYEALLSYRGFFAEQELFEVKPAGSEHDPLGQAWFVGRDDLPQYAEDEKVRDPDSGALLRHERGRFIYRLAGRDRQQSASYYTPEVLTRCLVAYSGPS
jgi:hypothetical protein